MKIGNKLFISGSIIIGLLIGGSYHYFYRGQSDSPIAAAPTLTYSKNQHNQSNRLRSPAISFHNAVVRASPAVVSIYTEQVSHVLDNKTDLTFNRFFRGNDNLPPLSQVITNQGSGVIINQGGYIITNKHLVDQTDTIIVSLTDNTQYPAKLIGSDTLTDLAVLKIDGPRSLPQIKLSQDEMPRVGDVVLAIGNPYDVGQTVTMGIVSATNRRYVTDTPVQDFIQIDAAINPGNSGGALINPYGELVGINTAIYAPENGAQGIGFAVPLRLVSYVVPQLIEQQQVKRGWLGILVDDLLYYPDIIQQHNTGALITGILEDSPAVQAQLQRGDIITHIDNRRVNNAHQLLLEITTTRPDKEIVLRGWRDKQKLQEKIKLAERPDHKVVKE